MDTEKWVYAKGVAFHIAIGIKSISHPITIATHLFYILKITCRQIYTDLFANMFNPAQKLSYAYIQFLIEKYQQISIQNTTYSAEAVVAICGLVDMHT